MKIMMFLMIVFFLFSVRGSDFYQFQPASEGNLRLTDGPGSDVINCEIVPGTLLKLLSREKEFLLFCDSEGNCGWTAGISGKMKDDFVQSENSFDDSLADPVLRDSKLDNLNSTDPPENSDLKIVVSLKGLTMHVTCEKEKFDRVYPIGVGVKGSSGKSITPTCVKKGVKAFRTHYSSANREFYMPKRWSPSHFGGFPFIRLNIRNSEGAYTYGMHGPITQHVNGEWYLQRGYVSHGCMRMRVSDVKELYPLTVKYPAACLIIQQDYEYDQNGNRVDCEYPLWHGKNS